MFTEDISYKFFDDPDERGWVRWRRKKAQKEHDLKHSLRTMNQPQTNITQVALNDTRQTIYPVKGTCAFHRL